jgi:uncharacterized protein YkwD
MTAHPAVPAAINKVRTQGCGGVPSTGAPLRESRKLNEAAQRMSRGDELHTSMEHAGYRAVKSSAVHMSGVPDDGDVEHIVSRQFCSQATDTELRDVGTYRRGGDVWIVLAAPFTPPAPRDAPTVSRRVLELTNQVRSRPRRCGRVAFPAAPPLTLSPTLERAAVEHSRDMAAHDDLDHKGHDGSTPADRVTRTGYKWRTVGENLASGVMTADEVVNGWAGSPAHCENLMSPRFTEMAVAYAVNPASDGGIYWTQVFGTPR